MSGEPVDPACVEGKAECSGDTSVVPFSVEMVVSTLLPSCFSKDWDTPPSGSKHSSPLPLPGQRSGLRRKLGCVCQHPRENPISVSDALLHAPHSPAVPARQARPVPARQARPVPAAAPLCCPHSHCRPGCSPGLCWPSNLPAPGQPFPRARGESGSSVVGVTQGWCVFQNTDLEKEVRE